MPVWHTENFGDSRKKRNETKKGMAEKWMAEKWGEKRLPRCCRCVGESNGAGSVPVLGRINPGTACSDRTGIQSLYRGR